MMEILKELTRNLVLLLLLATFLEMLLPKSDFNKYIRLVLGLFILLTILQPVMTIFDWQGKHGLPIREPPPEQLEELLARGLMMGEYQEKRAIKVAEERLEQQIAGMLYLVHGIHKVHVDLILENSEETGPVVTKALIQVTPNFDQSPVPEGEVQEVKPVVVGLESDSLSATGENTSPFEDKYHLTERIAQSVSSYLGLAGSQVQVELTGN